MMWRRVILGLLGVSVGLVLTQVEIRANNRAGEWTFIRVVHKSINWWGGLGAWDMDFPASDRNFLRRVRQVTNIDINPEPKVLSLTDPELFEHPFLYMLEVGFLYLNDEEVKALREYLLRGGFLMIDDFHGEFQWANFYREIKKVFPDREIEEVPIEHPIFHMVYDFDYLPQIPGIYSQLNGVTWEQGGFVPHCRAIFDDRRRLMVLINWNTDLGDGWEHSADPRYQRKYTQLAYMLGINFLIYAISH